MRFDILGPLRIYENGREIELSAAKPRMLLAIMLCRAGTSISTDRLLDMLWGARPPRTARENIRLYVHQLRRALGDAERIVRRPNGYAIVVGPEEVDAARFETLAQRGQAALRAGDPTSAAALLRQALSLWRGVPYADLDHLAELREEVDRLQERRQAVLETRIEADLARGAHHDLIGELTSLVGRYPLRERLRAQLMLALYRAGRQAEALAVARDGRRILAAELGLEPGPDLHNLELAILRGDPGLEPPTGPARTAGGDASAGGGRGGHEGGGPARSIPRQLPAYTHCFVGRSSELDQLSRLGDAAGEHRGAAMITVINGTAGIGKTALATRWAHETADRFPDGQLYVNLRGFDPHHAPAQPTEVLCGFLDALDVPSERVPVGVAAQSALYRSLLAERRMLVLLDNARDVEQVRPLLPGNSTCLTLITSRSRLTGLTVREGARSLVLDVLSPEEAEALLAGHLGTDRVGVEPAAVRELVGHCGRLPLALALVAARGAAHPRFPLWLLAEELRDEERRLDVLDASDTASGVRAVLSWSYQHISPTAARMFRLLGSHPGPDTGLLAAASLAGCPVEQAYLALQELTCAHLVSEHAPGRFAMHDLLRMYACQQAQAVDPAEERTSALRRLFDHYLHTAGRADRLLDPFRDRIHLDALHQGTTVADLADLTQAWAWCEAEYPVLLACMACALETGFATHAWQTYVSLTTFFERRGHWHDWESTGRAVLAATRDAGDPVGQGLTCLAIARAVAIHGRYQEALPYLRQALDLYGEADDPAGRANTYFALSWVFEHEGQLDEALGNARQALHLYRMARHKTGEARTLNLIGWQLAKLGDHQSALHRCREALELHREMGDQLGMAHTWDSIAYAHHHLGNHADAANCYQQAIELYRAQRNRYYEAGTLDRLGDAQCAMGELETACATWHRSLAMFNDLRHPAAEKVRAKVEARGHTAQAR